LRRFLSVLILLLAVLVIIGVPIARIVPALAQTATATNTPTPFRPQQGDPPVAARISISPPDANGIVTIIGQTNSVYPNAHLTIRNLYTEETIYLQAGVTGTFNARIYGEGNTPFWISPALLSTPLDKRGAPGSLPGGPGTIIVAPYPPFAQNEDVTRLAVDGRLEDWRAYPTARLTNEVLALRNENSLLIGIDSDSLALAYEQIRVIFTVNTSTYSVMVNPRTPSESPLRRLNPNQTDLPPLITASTAHPDANENTVEIRIPLGFLDPVNRLTLEEIDLVGIGESVLASYSLQDIPTPFVEAEIDGIFRPEGSGIISGMAFTLGGALGDIERRRASFWSAKGQVSGASLTTADTWRVEMDVRMRAQLPANARIIGQLSLQPIVSDIDGELVAANTGFANNGWSSTRFQTLPVDNVSIGNIALGEIIVEPNALIRTDDGVLFRLDATFDLSQTSITRGLYVPVLEGYVEVDGVREPWTQSALFNVENPRPETPRVSRMTQTRLPFVLNINGVQSARLPVALLYDDPSDGSRGVLPAQDADRFILSNRVRLNSPTYILPPFRDGTLTTAQYSLEPYLLNVLPNFYDSTTAPLIPFDLDSGVINVRVTKPDGTVDDFGDQAVQQSILSTSTHDERTRFGAQSPVDVYRLSTLNTALMRYSFDQYGEYTIELTLNIEDVFGNRYEGGGTYTVLSAEPLDLHPMTLHGTPFRMGDVFHSGVNISPGVPADVTVTLEQFSADGRRIFSQSISGVANQYGYYIPTEDAHQFTAPGIYTVDYDVRYTDAAGRLWAGSARAAGVIADDGLAYGDLTNTLIAHGERGLRDPNGHLLANARSAWFNTENNALNASVEGLVNFPYFSGDVAWIGETADSGMWAVIRAQDIDGRYQTALRDQIARQGDNTALDVGRMLALDEAPVNLYTAERGYTIISATRPGLTVRSFVVGGDYYGDRAYDNLPMWWDADDPYNGQIGAGITGDRPGDYTFLFGGLMVSDEAVGIEETAIYASLAVVTDANDPRGERVYPPLNGSAGGGDGGALVSIDDTSFDAFFVPTAALPGTVLTVGDTVSIAGQAAPTLDALVQVTITAPSGETRVFEGRANPIGYFYDPSHDFIADEAGVWTVRIRTIYDVLTSVGQAQAPYIEGTILSVSDDEYFFYVLQPSAPALDSNIQLADTLIPTGTPYNFSFTTPADWRNTRAYITIATPQYIITDSPVNVSGRSFSYQWTPALIRGSFPMIENEPRAVGNAVVEPVTFVFVATGTDANGVAQIRLRRFTLFYNRLVSGWSLQSQK